MCFCISVPVNGDAKRNVFFFFAIYSRQVYLVLPLQQWCDDQNVIGYFLILDFNFAPFNGGQKKS